MHTSRQVLAAMAPIGRFLIFAFFGVGVHISATDPGDVAVLKALKDSWQNTPTSWGNSDDPCESWEGVTCNNDSRVTGLKLTSMDLLGELSGDIGGLTELKSLDLSFNKGLTGSLSPWIGDLKKLNLLVLAGCSFSGIIPNQIGNLAELTFLALNSNHFSGSIPPHLGKLTRVWWLDLSDNQLTGSLPVSTPDSPGLDQLTSTKHFHFKKNQLSGSISEQLFSSDMELIHILFDENQFNGSIPKTIGLLRRLEVLQLDRNGFTGEVPSNINNLTSLKKLDLANNNLTGRFPDLSGMNSLSYVDLSNNSFDLSDAPLWFSTLQSLTTLIAEHGSLQGRVPQKLFSLPLIQQVELKNNAFNDTLNLEDHVGSHLQLFDFENNQISRLIGASGLKNCTLILIGNPVCTTDLSNSDFCRVQQQSKEPYCTSLANCVGRSCPDDQKLSPQSCECAYPYEGTMYFIIPSFRGLSNVTVFQELEMSLREKLDPKPGSVLLQSPSFNADGYLQVQLALFPSTGKYFSRSEIQRLGSEFSGQTYRPPSEFGSYNFKATPYPFPESHGGAIGAGVVAGIASGSALLVLVLVLLGIVLYAFRQKRRAEGGIVLGTPFESWVRSRKNSVDAPQLKGARWFSYDELRNCTSNFSESNEIGSGGYGNVYKGTLPDGQLVAIKRAKQGSVQGGLEFKTEIELLSRVHHKNLVSLVGFCCERGEQMLVYEFCPMEILGRACQVRASGIYLDWKKRLLIALGTARGLDYLHEHAYPPIIHRDVKSTNILLDQNLGAKVTDFGLSKLVFDSSKGYVSSQVKGTPGYLDPEYYTSQKLTEKSDAYSFGVVMLELVTARQALEKGKYLVREVRMALDMSDEEHCGLRDVMDPAIRNMGSLIGFRRFLELAMQCLEETPANRPTMSEVVKAIETLLQNGGLNTNLNSASSSTTDLCPSKGVITQIYGDASPRKNVNNDKNHALDYSGDCALNVKVEPK